MGLEPTIRAAGGVVIRPSNAARDSILLVHRPAYDDWTLPKGKNAEHEDDADCAIREVKEETGLLCALGSLVTEVEYRDHKDRAKTVAYFFMTPIEGSFSPNDEVDEIRWAEPEEAMELLTYPRDADVVRCALESNEIPPHP